MGPWVVHMPEEGVLHSSETLHCLLVMWTCFIKNKKSVFYSGRSLLLVVVSHMDSRSFYSWILLNSLLCLKTLTLFLRDLFSLRLNKDQFILFPGQTFLFSVLWEHLPHPTLDLVSSWYPECGTLRIPFLMSLFSSFLLSEPYCGLKTCRPQPDMTAQVSSVNNLGSSISGALNI